MRGDPALGEIPGSSSLTPKRLERQRMRAVAELVDVGAGLIENRQQQIRHRHVVFIRVVMTRLDLPAEIAREQAGQIEMTVQIAVSHSATEQREAMIQQGSIAIGGVLQPREEVIQQL